MDSSVTPPSRIYSRLDWRTRGWNKIAAEIILSPPRIRYSIVNFSPLRGNEKIVFRIDFTVDREKARPEQRIPLKREKFLLVSKDIGNIPPVVPLFCSPGRPQG